MKYYNAAHRFFVKPGTHFDNETWRLRRCAETGVLRMNVIDKYSRSRVVFLKEIGRGNLAIVDNSDMENPFSEAAVLVSEGMQTETQPPSPIQALKPKGKGKRSRRTKKNKS